MQWEFPPDEHRKGGLEGPGQRVTEGAEGPGGTQVMSSSPKILGCFLSCCSLNQVNTASPLPKLDTLFYALCPPPTQACYSLPDSEKLSLPGLPHPIVLLFPNLSPLAFLPADFTVGSTDGFSVPTLPDLPVSLDTGDSFLL